MKKLLYIINLFSVLVAVACSSVEHDAQKLNEPVNIYPDYTEIIVPCNFAPLCFRVKSELSDLQAVVSTEEGQIVVSANSKREITLAPKTDVSVRIQGKDKDSIWREYDSFNIYVSQDSIDSYLVYRLIEPSYEGWDKMGIYQRCLESFEQTSILENTETNGGCMNCHSFNRCNPEEMLFHLRVDYGGTYLVRNGNVEKLNTKTPETISALVYPYWHPSGKYVAFSTNLTKQMFHTTSPNRIEVFDYASDVVVYDVEKHEIFSCPQLKSPTAFETFPTFSPDGRMLYFCSADSVKIPDNYEDVHYSLCAIAFNPEEGTFGEKVDTLVNSASVSFPRISPDGRWLMYTLSDYGNFSIWHQEAELWMIDLKTSPLSAYHASTLSSESVESYHSWSSNGRWVVFSSRRDDGLYTRPYLAHFDGEGNFSKPFILPQKDTEHYQRLMKSFNIPEFVSAKVTTSGKSLSDVARQDNGIDLRYKVY